MNDLFINQTNAEKFIKEFRSWSQHLGEHPSSAHHKSCFYWFNNPKQFCWIVKQICSTSSFWSFALPRLLLPTSGPTSPLRLNWWDHPRPRRQRKSKAKSKPKAKKARNKIKKKKTDRHLVKHSSFVLHNPDGSDSLTGYWQKSQNTFRKQLIYLLLMVIALPSIGLTSLRGIYRDYHCRSERHVCFQLVFIPDRGVFQVNYVITGTFIGAAVMLLHLIFFAKIWSQS